MRESTRFGWVARALLVLMLGSTSSASAGLSLKTEKAVYKLGERIVIEVHFPKNGFLYLFNVRADGLIDLLIPNRFGDGDSRSWAGETRRFPQADSGWWFVAPEPTGKHLLIALLAPEGIKLDGLAVFEAGNPFARLKTRGLIALEQALKTRIPKSATRANFTYSVAKK